MDNKNVFIAIALSMSVLLFWSALVDPPQPNRNQNELVKNEQSINKELDSGIVPNINDSKIKQKISREESIKKTSRVLLENNKITDQWNPFNILATNAATVGNFDLDIINENVDLISDLNANKFEIVYLLGQDDLNFNKKNEFVIYQGSHGERGAETADIILPGAAYTEQNGYYTNLEGKIQKAYKASYPPGDAKEDWQIINELAELMNNRKLFNDKEELESSMMNYLNLKKEKQSSNLTKNVIQNNFENEDIKVVFKDYYFSNVIARASKTMLECNNSKINIKRTGTEG